MSKTEELVRIEKLADRLGVPEWKVKMALGIPLTECPATTTQEACRAFQNALAGSEEQRMAFIKWVELCTSAEQAKSAFFLTLDGSSLQKIAMTKWDELSLLEVRQVATFEEARTVYNVVRTGSQADENTLLKLIDFSPTLEDVIEVLAITSDGSKEEMAAIAKIAELTKDEPEA